MHPWDGLQVWLVVGNSSTVTNTRRKDNMQKWCARAKCVGHVPWPIQWSTASLLSKLHLIHAEALAPHDIARTWTENFWDQINEPLKDDRSLKPETFASPVHYWELVPVTHGSWWLHRPADMLQQESFSYFQNNSDPGKSFPNSTFPISWHICLSLEPYKVGLPTVS